MYKTLGLVLANVVLLVAGQILWKTGVNRLGSLDLSALPRLFVSPWIWGGILLFGAATVIWLVALSRAALSTLYPLQSLAYILGMAAGVLLFHEKVSWTGWLGGFLIFTGIYLIAKSGL
ncbi:MAG: hypothetical protein HPY58_12380 [Firmicutes bacterium]|nr:hypothetical protein [Bacillota bacterium]